MRFKEKTHAIEGAKIEGSGHIRFTPKPLRLLPSSSGSIVAKIKSGLSVSS